jgi:hypothetical protein
MKSERKWRPSPHPSPWKGEGKEFGGKRRSSFPLPLGEGKGEEKQGVMNHVPTKKDGRK